MKQTVRNQSLRGADKHETLMRSAVNSTIKGMNHPATIQAARAANRPEPLPVITLAVEAKRAGVQQLVDSPVAERQRAGIDLNQLSVQPVGPAGSIRARVVERDGVFGRYVEVEFRNEVVTRHPFRATDGPLFDQLCVAAARVARSLDLKGASSWDGSVYTIHVEVQPPSANDPVYVAVINAGFVHESTKVGARGKDVTYVYAHPDGRRVEHLYGAGWTIIQPSGAGVGGWKYDALVTALKATAKVRYDEKKAMRQGWLLAHDGGRYDIQRYDAAEKFADDAAAARYVIKRAHQGDSHAEYCLMVVMTQDAEPVGKKIVRDLPKEVR